MKDISELKATPGNISNEPVYWRMSGTAIFRKVSWMKNECRTLQSSTVGCFTCEGKCASCVCYLGDHHWIKLTASDVLSLISLLFSSLLSPTWFCCQSLVFPRPWPGCTANLPPQAVSYSTKTHTRLVVSAWFDFADGGRKIMCVCDVDGTFHKVNESEIDLIMQICPSSTGDLFVDKVFWMACDWKGRNGRSLEAFQWPQR